MKCGSVWSRKGNLSSKTNEMWRCLIPKGQFIQQNKWNVEVFDPERAIYQAKVEVILQCGCGLTTDIDDQKKIKPKIIVIIIISCYFISMIKFVIGIVIEWEFVIVWNLGLKTALIEITACSRGGVLDGARAFRGFQRILIAAWLMQVLSLAFLANGSIKLFIRTVPPLCS